MTNKTPKEKNALTNSVEFRNMLIEGLKAGRPLNGTDGILTPMIKEALEVVLDGEMGAYMDTNAAKDTRRNGKTTKVIKTPSGEFELETPRDRNGTFEPQIVKKRQTVLTEELDQKILSLFGNGMSYRDISSHLNEMYGVKLSPATMTAITDKLLPVITEWKNRPLDDVYPIVFLDAMFFKQREEGRVVTKASYTVLGINQDGYKDILGMYVTDGEGANFWLGVLNDLQSRGVKDILIACVDGLKGFPDAINAIFPKTEIQLCIVHQIRNSLKYVVSKEQKVFMSDLKLVYKASTKELAEDALLNLDEKWGKRYPTVIRSWNNNWENLSNYFKYPHEIRKLIYTTNSIEGFHRQVRKYTKTKGAFTSENALIKLIYCATSQIKKKWNMPLSNWALSICQLDIYFEGRLNLAIN